MSLRGLSLASASRKPAHLLGPAQVLCPHAVSLHPLLEHLPPSLSSRALCGVALCVEFHSVGTTTLLAQQSRLEALQGQNPVTHISATLPACRAAPLRAEGNCETAKP